MLPFKHVWLFSLNEVLKSILNKEMQHQARQTYQRKLRLTNNTFFTIGCLVKKYKPTQLIQMWCKTYSFAEPTCLKKRACELKHPCDIYHTLEYTYNNKDIIGYKQGKLMVTKYKSIQLIQMYRTTYSYAKRKCLKKRACELKHPCDIYHTLENKYHNKDIVGY